jgi:hypothetical protein
MSNPDALINSYEDFSGLTEVPEEPEVPEEVEEQITLAREDE